MHLSFKKFGNVREGVDEEGAGELWECEGVFLVLL
jgi:hypothetical protein